MGEVIYKLMRPAEWAVLEAEGTTAGSDADRADGFVHLSAAGQLAGTLARHFAGEDGLMLVAVDAAAAGPALLWEPSRGGALFPHLYRPLARGDVLWARPLFPDGLPEDGAA